MAHISRHLEWSQSCPVICCVCGSNIQEFSTVWWGGSHTTHGSSVKTCIWAAISALLAFCAQFTFSLKVKNLTIWTTNSAVPSTPPNTYTLAKPCVKCHKVFSYHNCAWHCRALNSIHSGSEVHFPLVANEFLFLDSLGMILATHQWVALALKLSPE